jgi:hypothetical protein
MGQYMKLVHSFPIRDMFCMLRVRGVLLHVTMGEQAWHHGQAWLSGLESIGWHSELPVYGRFKFGCQIPDAPDLQMNAAVSVWCCAGASLSRTI